MSTLPRNLGWRPALCWCTFGSRMPVVERSIFLEVERLKARELSNHRFWTRRCTGTWSRGAMWRRRTHTGYRFRIWRHLKTQIRQAESEFFQLVQLVQIRKPRRPLRTSYQRQAKLTVFVYRPMVAGLSPLTLSAQAGACGTVGRSRLSVSSLECYYQ